MAEIATIARPYAEALFKASGADLAGTQGWLDALAAVASDAGLQAFAASPNATNAQVLDVTAHAAKVTLPAAANNFLSAVIENGRLTALPEIATQFRALKNAKSGVSDAVVYSAFAIEGAALSDLVVLLEKRFATKINATVQIDATLIGGVRVVVGDQVLDTSVKARLEQMKAALTA